MSILTKPAVIVTLLAIFIFMALLGGPSNGSEVAIMEWMRHVRAGQPEVSRVVAGITNLGGGIVTIPLAALASLWLLLRGDSASALLLAGTVLVERSLVEWLKVLIGRPRPEFGAEWLPHSLAYPSGHSANSMAAYLAIALLLVPAARRGPWAVGALFLSVVVGLTRIFLGVHWPSDVIGGWSFGILAVAVAITIGERSGALHFEEQHKIIGRHVPPLDQDKTA